MSWTDWVPQALAVLLVWVAFFVYLMWGRND